MTRKDYNKIDFALSAEQVLINHELAQYDGYSVESFRNSMSWFLARMKRLEQTYLLEKNASSQIASDLLKDVSEMLYKTSIASGNKEAVEGVIRFMWLAEHVFGARLEQDVLSHEEGRRIAIFCLGLTLLGSSANQAFKSLSEWTGRGSKSLESLYADIKIERNIYAGKKNIESFVSTFEVDLAVILLKHNDLNFPAKKGSLPYNKTHQAYLMLRKEIINRFKNPNHFERLSVPAPSDINNWERYRELKLKIIALPEK